MRTRLSFLPIVILEAKGRAGSDSASVSSPPTPGPLFPRFRGKPACALLSATSAVLQRVGSLRRSSAPHS